MGANTSTPQGNDAANNHARSGTSGSSDAVPKLARRAITRRPHRTPSLSPRPAWSLFAVLPLSQDRVRVVASFVIKLLS